MKRGSALPVLALAAAAVMAAGPASAQDAAEFYKDKTVRVMVPSGLGATLGLYGRLVTDHIGKHIPGHPTVVIESRAGAGGTVGAAYAYNVAPKDGTYIAQVLAPSIYAPLLRELQFDATKFQWLGSVTPRPAVVSVWHTSPVKTVEAAKKSQIILGSTGVGSETFVVPMLMNDVLGTKFKIVKGYKGGGALNKALEQGEIQGRMQYWSGWTAGKPQWLEEHKLVHLVKYGGAIPELKNVPDLEDLVTGEEAKSMVHFVASSPRIGIGFWVPPEVPKDRVAVLRKAFMEMLDDPAFRKSAEKLKAPVQPVAGEALQKIVEAVYATPKPTVEKLRGILGF